MLTATNFTETGYDWEGQISVAIYSDSETNGDIDHHGHPFERKCQGSFAQFSGTPSNPLKIWTKLLQIFLLYQMMLYWMQYEIYWIE